MFRFEHPEFFIAFTIVLVLALAYATKLALDARARKSLATSRAYARLTDKLLVRVGHLRAGLMILGCALLCLALTNPQWGSKRETVTAESADIFIALDISTSMLAEDIAPNRLERARRFAQKIVSRFKGDRIGLIMFAGNAYLQMPLTRDYASAELFLRSAHPGLASTQGTSIGDAISLAMRAYEEDVNHQKALVIITDGENHEEGALEAMERGRESGLIPFVVSVGTKEGAFIPITLQGRQDYKRDETGNPVKTSVNEEFLSQLAETGGGVAYSILANDAVLDDMEDRIALISKQEMEQRAFTDYSSYYQYFLLGAILLIIASLLVRNNKRATSEVD